MITKKIQILFISSVSLLLICFIRHLVISSKLKKIADQIIIDKSTDQEKILALLNYCYKIETTSVKNYTHDELNKMFTGRKLLLAKYYKSLPINLINPYIVLNYHLSYSGPCGAKSKLLNSLLKSQGYQSSLVEVLSPSYSSIHSLVKINIEGTWSLLDPTLNLYFLNNKGKFLPLDSLNEKNANYNNSINKLNPIEKANPQDYTYNNVKQTTVIHGIQSILKLFVKFPKVSKIDQKINFLISNNYPLGFLHYEIGTPYFYDQPTLFPVTFFLIISILLGIKFFKAKKRNLNREPSVSKESTKPLKERSLA